MIKYCYYDEETITIALEDGSIAELSRIDNKELIEYNLNLPDPIFFFHRLKSRIENQGSGTILMNKLMLILIELDASVVCEARAYKSDNQEKLIRFYKKFGFKETETENLMYWRRDDCNM